MSLAFEAKAPNVFDGCVPASSRRGTNLVLNRNRGSHRTQLVDLHPLSWRQELVSARLYEGRTGRVGEAHRSKRSQDGVGLLQQRSGGICPQECPRIDAAAGQ